MEQSDQQPNFDFLQEGHLSIDYRGRVHNALGHFVKKATQEKVTTYQLYQDEIEAGLNGYDSVADKFAAEKQTVEVTASEKTAGSSEIPAAKDAPMNVFEMVQDASVTEDEADVEEPVQEPKFSRPWESNPKADTPDDELLEDEPSELSIFADFSEEETVPLEEPDLLSKASEYGSDESDEVADDDDEESIFAGINSAQNDRPKKEGSFIGRFRDRLMTASILARDRVLEKTANLRNRNNSSTESGGDHEKRNKALALTGVVLGAAAIFLAARYAADYDGGNGNGGFGLPALDIPEFDFPDQENDRSGAGEGNGVKRTQRLSEGQNIWTESISYADKLGFQTDPNNPQDIAFIDAIKDEVLRTNNVGDPTQMAIGTEIDMPEEEKIKQLRKKYR